MSEPLNLHVVAAIVVNQQHEVLIAQRALHKHEGGKWEFPGGKVEAMESPEVALKRELLEEVALTILACEPFMQVTHHYPASRQQSARTICLDVYLVTEFHGQAISNEGQRIRWVKLAELESTDFPAANQSILQKLKATPRFSARVE